MEVNIRKPASISASFTNGNTLSANASAKGYVQGPKGDKGDRGEKGDPFRYEDFTAEQLEALRGLAGRDGRNGSDGLPGRDGYTPVKGVDYFDGKDGQNGRDGYTPIKGVDYFDGQPGRDGTNGKDGSDYVLTDSDKQQIATQAAAKVDLSGYTKKEDIPSEVTLEINRMAAADEIVTPWMLQEYAQPKNIYVPYGLEGLDVQEIFVKANSGYFYACVDSENLQFANMTRADMATYRLVFANDKYRYYLSIIDGSWSMEEIPDVGVIENGTY